MYAENITILYKDIIRKSQYLHNLFIILLIFVTILFSDLSFMKSAFFASSKNNFYERKAKLVISLLFLNIFF
jgi:hypothetical protein